jgi:hypothetical protein
VSRFFSDFANITNFNKKFITLISTSTIPLNLFMELILSLTYRIYYYCFYYIFIYFHIESPLLIEVFPFFFFFFYYDPMFIRGFTDVLVLEMGMLQVSIRCFFTLKTPKQKSKLENNGTFPNKIELEQWRSWRRRRRRSLVVPVSIRPKRERTCTTHLWFNVHDYLAELFIIRRELLILLF